MHAVSQFFQQKVNSFLCIALISILTFWVALYYFGTRAELIGENWVGPYAAATGE